MAEMDAFDFDNAKAEKASAVIWYSSLRNVAKLFRLAEICLALVLLFWIFTQLPLVIRISGQCFWQLIAVVISPIFIFVVSNVIVISLLVKSGQIAGQTPAAYNVETDLYEELINNSEILNYGLENSPLVPEEIVYQDKEIVSEVNNITPARQEVVKVANTTFGVKDFRRSQSENLTRESCEKPCEKLRRSETEKCRTVTDSGEVPAETGFLVDELSSEEFNRTVEQFIAKQVKFHQEEKMAIVAC